MKSLLSYLRASPTGQEPAPSPSPISSALSPASEEILRRGTWDYMWRRTRDRDVQEHPQFEPQASPEFCPYHSHDD